MTALPSPLLKAQNLISSKVADKQATTALPPLRCDVVVVGAGPSGLPAAISAAREGANVILLEEDMAVGGAAVDMFVIYMCGAPRTGIYLDVVSELNRNHSLDVTPSKTFGKYAWDNKQHWWLPSAFQLVWNDIVSQYPNLHLICGAPVVDTIVVDGGNRNVVKGVCFMRNGQLQRVEGVLR